MTNSINDYSISQTNPDIIFAVGMDSSWAMLCYKTTDGGNNWSFHSFPDINIWGYNITVDPVDYDIAYACGNGIDAGNVCCIVKKTTDGGNEWDEIWRDSTRAYVSVIAIDSVSNNRIYIGTSEGVYISEDFGASWTEPVDTIKATTGLVFDPISSNEIYASGSEGVYKSVDSGVTWEKVDSSLVFRNVLCLDSDPLNRSIYAGTKGGSIYRTSLQTGVDENVPCVPYNFTLYQNYPNPFNSGTIISFLIPHSGKAKLEVFNLRGQKVITLLEEIHPAGNGKILWTASGFASGIYFYRLTSGERIIAKRMMLLK